MRASDADREAIAERLRRATAEGRLLAYELEERLARALRARTYGELDAVVADLPGEPRVASRRRSGVAVHVHPAVALVVAVPLALVAVALVMALAVFVISGFFAMWVMWLVLWMVFGRHLRRPGGRRGPGSPWGAGPRRVGPWA
jgi:Flp pilus assembly protein TadB